MITTKSDAIADRLPDTDLVEPRRRFGWWLGLGAVLMLVLATIGAALIPVPYYAITPGSVRPLGDVVLVDGVDAHPPQTPVSFTTVNLRDVRLLEAAVNWLDPDVVVVPEDQIRQGRTEDESRQMNVVMMDTSKQVAITVALRHLGYDVEVVTSGTVVVDVDPGAPAAGALEPGDAVVAVGGEPLASPGALGEQLQEGGPGATHVLTVERAGSGEREDVEIETVASPDDPGRALIGILTTERIVDFDYPFEIDIDSGTVGGPSAGLAFALAVLDHLTPGELAGGARVAVTGTIALDGTVGRVGGAPQKAVAVRDQGYDAFIVPAELAPSVEERAGDDLEVIGVSTLDEALEALASLGGNALALGRPGEQQPAA